MEQSAHETLQFYGAVEMEPGEMDTMQDVVFGNENVHTGTENEGETAQTVADVAGPLPSTSRAASSSDPVSAAPKNPPTEPKLSPGISENNNDHIPGCNFILWNVTHRRSLITEEDFRNYLLDFKIRTTGKNKAIPIMDKIKRKVDEQVKGPIIQKYLKDSHATYEKFKNLMMSKCSCPKARLQKSSEQRLSSSSSSSSSSGSSSSGSSSSSSGSSSSSPEHTPFPPSVVIASTPSIPIPQIPASSNSQSILHEDLDLSESD